MLPGLNPKQIAKMMKQMGIDTKELPARRVVIESDSGTKIVIENPSVTEINMQGQKTFQVSGEVREETSEETGKEEITEDDIKMVMEKTGKDRETVLKTLKETDGNIAEAILKLQD